MNILIFGGTGVLSTDFVSLLVDNNNVTIINRGINKHLINEKAELIKLDIRKTGVDDIVTIVGDREFDVVVDFLTYNPSQLIKMTKILEKMKYKQYIFISSATVFNNGEGNPISENSSIGNDKWDYALNKLKCEEILTESKINYTIIRPYVTYSNTRIPFQIYPDCYYYTIIQRIKNNKPIILYEDGKNYCTITHSKDFARMLYKLLLNEKAYKNSFNLTSSFVHTWLEIYLTLCEVLNKKPLYYSINKQNIQKYLPLYKDVLEGDKGTDKIFDNSKILSVLGDEFAFQYSLRDGLKETISFFENHAEMQGIDYRFEGEVDYYLKKEFKVHNLKKVNGNCSVSTKKYLYYLFSNTLLRELYSFLKKVKTFIKK